MDEGCWGGEDPFGTVGSNKNKPGDVTVSLCRQIASEWDDLEPKVGRNGCGPEKDPYILPTNLTINNSQVLHNRQTYPFVKAHFFLQIIERCSVFMSQIYIWQAGTASFLEGLATMPLLFCSWLGPSHFKFNVSFNRIHAGRIFVRKADAHYTLWCELALHTATCLQPTPNSII
jgi:hypothetical protein